MIAMVQAATICIGHRDFKNDITASPRIRGWYYIIRCRRGKVSGLIGECCEAATWR
jgi:hypothetical protein